MKDIYNFYESVFDDDEAIESNPEVNKHIIDSWMHDNHINSYEVLKDGTINIGSEYRNSTPIVIKTDILSIGKLGKCLNNLEIKGLDIEDLSTLPRVVQGSLYINDCNKLKDLTGCPEITRGKLVINNCKNISSLEGCPKDLKVVQVYKNSKKFEWKDIQKYCKLAEKNKCVWG